MFGLFEKKEDEVKLALVYFSPKDCDPFHKTFASVGWGVDFYGSESWGALAEKCDKYKVILVDMKLGGGALAIEIVKVLIRAAYKGKIFLLAGGSMVFYTERYLSVLMKEAILQNPGLVVDNVGVSEGTAIAETVCMERALAHGRR